MNTMDRKLDVAIIGGGQAGLSTSYFLSQEGREHAIFERNSIGASWRNARWDSFTLVTPNWTIKLPGYEYNGAEPDSFMPRDEVVSYLERYAAEFKAPVRAGVEVTSVTPVDEGGYLLETSEGAWRANNVVVAVSLFHTPKVPALARRIPESITQIHASEYRNPGALPPGAVLVVGSAQSGCQIAEELNDAGRTVYLSVGSAGRLPRRYRGKDGMWWGNMGGIFDATVDKLPSPRAKFGGNPHVTGKNGGHTLNLHNFARDGIKLVGRVVDAEGDKLHILPNLRENMAKADTAAAEIIKAIDENVLKLGLNVPEDPSTREAELANPEPPEETTELDLRAAGISTVVWASGFSFDFSWVRLPVFDDDGYPVQQRGVTAAPGLYFVGLHWLYKAKSGLLLGVGEDAAHVAGHIVERARVN